ncbi:MAG: hypothetical protein R3281_11205 [Balneolaceae bacterium]|nr:hypothetical protein [Balneolaceae bacterium]
MQIDWFTFFAQIVNFLILVLLLRRFLYNPVMAAMDQREKRIEERLEEGRRKLADANEKESEYKKKLRRFDQQKEEMIREAKSEVEQKRKKMMDEVRSEIAEIQQRWENTIESERESFLQELQITAGKQIIEVVRLIVEDLADRSLESQVTGIFIQNLEDMSPEQNKKLVSSALDYGDGTIQVKSSYPIDEVQKREITRILEQKVVPNVKCNFEVVSTLGFGIELWAGGWRVGWNLKRYLGKLRHDLEQAVMDTEQVSSPGTVKT